MKYSLRDRVLCLQRQYAAVGLFLFAVLTVTWLPMADYAFEMESRPVPSVLSMLASMVIAGLMIWPACEAWRQAWVQQSTGLEPSLPKPRFRKHPEPPSWGKPPPVPPTSPTRPNP
jgi:hypothetical protein